MYLKDESGLRQSAYCYFHNLTQDNTREKNFIVDDFIKVFGGRNGPFGHNEPVLDDDSWQQVDRATAILDKRFPRWTGGEVISIEEFVLRQLRLGQPPKDIATEAAEKFEVAKSEAFKLALALRSKSGGP